MSAAAHERRGGLPLRQRLLEVPAEVDLGAHDLLLIVEGKNLGIPSPAATGDVALVGDDDLVARLDQPDELEVLAPAGAWPAALEEAVTVELRVRWRGEEEVIAQTLVEEAPIAGCKGRIEVADDLLAVGDGRRSLMLAPTPPSREEQEPQGRHGWRSIARQLGHEAERLSS